MPPAQGTSPDPYALVRRLLTDAGACPSCAAALTSARCTACGLDLAGADARELWTLSQRAAGALDARQAHLAGMRGRQRQATTDAHRRAATEPSTARAVAARGAAAQALPSARTAPVTPDGPRLGHSRPPAPPRAPAAPPRTPAAARAPLPAPEAGPSPRTVPTASTARPLWRVQTVLQVLGASLLAAASIVFLLFSWGWIPLAGRAVAVAVGTVVVFAVASRLRRSGLTSSAEAVGGLAAVLLLLDAWAVPATGLVRPAEPAVYAGVAALVCGAALAVWGVRARLRVGTLAGAVLVPVAPLLLAPLVPSAGGFAGLACVALALTTARFSGRTAAPDRHAVERAVLGVLAWALVAAVASVAAVAALLDGAGWDAPTAPAWGSVAALVAAAVLAAVQSRLMTARVDPEPDGGPVPAAGAGSGATATFAGFGGAARVWATLAGALAAVAALAVVVLLTRAGAVEDAALWALVPLAPTLVTLGLRLARRARGGEPWTAQGAHAVALLASVPTVVALPLVTAASLVEPDAAPGPAAVALVLGAAATVALTRAAARQARVGSWIAGAVFVATPVALASVWPGLVGTGLVLGLLAVAALVFAGDAAGVRPVLGGSAPARTVVVLAVLGALAASHGAPGPLAAALAATAALGVGTRRWLARPAALRAAALAAAALLGWSATVVALVAAGIDPAVARTSSACVVVTACLVLAVRRGGAPPDRVAWLTAGAATLGTAWPWAVAASSPDGSGVLRALVVLLAVLALAGSALVAVRGRTTVPRSARVAAAVVAPLGALTVVSLERAPGSTLPGSTLAVGVAAAGAVGVLLAPVLARGAAVDAVARLGSAAEAATHDEHARRAAEAGGWAVLAAAVATASGAAPTGSAANAALVLLVAAITSGAWSLAPGRRWARWGTLALATVASWVLLGAGDVGTPEAYLAPAGLVLAVVGARRWRAAAEGDVALLGAGLALATVPSALLDGELAAGLPRFVVAGIVGTVLVALVELPVVRRRPGAGTSRLQPQHVLSLLGGLLAVLGPWSHALLGARSAAAGGSGDPLFLTVEAASLPAAAVVATAAWRLARDPSATHLRVAAWSAWAVAAAAAVPTVVAVRDSGGGLVRTVAVLVVGAALALETARRTSAVREHADLAVVGLAVAGLATLAGAATLTEPPGDALVALLGLLALAVAVRRTGGGTAPWWGTAGALLALPLALGDGAWRAVAAGGLAAALVGVAVRVRTDDAARELGAPAPAPDRAPTGTSSAAPRGPATRVAPSTHTLVLATAAALALLGPARHATAAAGGPGAGLSGVEAWSLPAAVLLAGVLRELTRQAAPRAATAPAGPAPRVVAWARRVGVWLVAAVAVVPTAVAVAVAAPVSSSLPLGRMLALLAGGATVAVAGVTGAAPPRRVLGTSLVPVGLAVAGLAWFASAAAPSDPPPSAVLAAVGLLVTGVGTVVVTRSDRGASWPFLGALLVLPLMLGPAPWGGPAVGLLVAMVALGAGWALGRVGLTARARAVPLAVAAVLTVTVAGRHTVDAASTTPGPRVELIALATALVLGATVALLGRAWPFTGPGPRSWAAWPVALAAAAPTLVAAADDPADLGRPGAVLVVGSCLAVVGAARTARVRATVPAAVDRAHADAGARAGAGAGAGRGALVGHSDVAPADATVGGVRAVQLRAVGLVLAAAAALLAAVRGGEVPVDAPLVLLGATLLAVGVLALLRDASASSWVCLAPGLILAVVVPVTTGWSEPTMWRLVLVLVGATAAVVVGAVRRWQAPFVLGAAALAVVAVVQASPAAVAAMQVVEWWVVLALGGAVLLGLGLTYERRLREAREAARFVVAMR
ncbi:SCO7613 C-terminal domain-containing membrane protein [Cellulomonas sp. NPDC055163]